MILPTNFPQMAMSRDHFGCYFWAGGMGYYCYPDYKPGILLDTLQGTERIKNCLIKMSIADISRNTGKEPSTPAWL